MFKKFLCYLLFLAVLVGASGAVALFDAAVIPSTHIRMLAEDSQTVDVFAEYTDAGCVAEYGSEIIGYKSIPYETVGAVDTAKTGVYTLNYETAGDYPKASASRTVYVKDSVAPTIEAPNAINAYIGTTAFAVKYTAKDNYDGDLTAAVKKQDLADRVLLTVADSSGNKTQHTVMVNFVEDATPPTLTLSGFVDTYVMLGKTFVEPGYTATDNKDGNLTAKVTVSGTVNTAVEGNYVLTYTVSDETGNTTIAKRNVGVYKTVQAPAGTNPTGPVIYLTFDDGPGKYTQRLLSILADKGVKATFFVTNQFPKYQYLIGEAHKQGHAIAVHTYSHQWSIYRSKDAYYNDFKMMNDIIAKYTGQTSKIFRFPGGTSNVVSKKQCKGIMTLLNTEMAKSGYVEFDWNVDSCDTSLSRPGQVANQVIRNLSKSRPNIVLMHDIKAHTVNSVETIINYGIKNGYTFATLNENSPKVQLPVAN